MKNKINEAVYETAKDLHKAGLISNERMKKYEKLNLPEIHTFQPADIKHLREKEHVSQSLFAAYLNTSLSAVRKWESGEKKPSGMALRLLNLIEKKGLEIII
jgi:putative transcriptional regulator